MKEKKTNNTTEEKVKKEVKETVEDNSAEEVVIEDTKKEEDNQLEKLQAELDEQKDLFLRKVAEFDNYKKRTQRETERIGLDSRAAVVKELLPVLDNINRSLTVENITDADYKKGMEMVVKQLFEILKKVGLEEINPVGEEFDPNFHNAVSQVEDENLGDNTVAQVWQLGYKMGDSILRTATVSVANCK